LKQILIYTVVTAKLILIFNLIILFDYLFHKSISRSFIVQFIASISQSLKVAEQVS